MTKRLRSPFERRSGNDRRKIGRQEHFPFEGDERRTGKERRSGKDRRKDWIGLPELGCIIHQEPRVPEKYSRHGRQYHYPISRQGHHDPHPCLPFFRLSFLRSLSYIDSKRPIRESNQTIAGIGNGYKILWLQGFSMCSGIRMFSRVLVLFLFQPFYSFPFPRLYH